MLLSLLLCWAELSSKSKPKARAAEKAPTGAVAPDTAQHSTAVGVQERVAPPPCCLWERAASGFRGDDSTIFGVEVRGTRAVFAPQGMVLVFFGRSEETLRQNASRKNKRNGIWALLTMGTVVVGCRGTLRPAWPGYCRADGCRGVGGGLEIDEIKKKQKSLCEQSGLETWFGFRT